MELDNNDDTDAEYVPDKEEIQNDSDTDKILYSKATQSNVSRQSETWKHFEVSSDDPSSTLLCKISKQDLDSTNSSNLSYHLKKQHNRTDVDNVDSSDDERGNPLSTSTKRRNRSRGWKYFDVKDPENKIACCKVCRKDISYNTVGNLMKHTLRKHTTAEFKPTTSCDNDQKNGEIMFKAGQIKRVPRELRKRQMRHRSLHWKYFVVQDDVAKIAQCNMCHNNFVYNNPSNLKRHLVSKHKGVKLDPFTDDEVEPDAKEAEVEATSPVWAYYRCLDERLQIASCLICKKRIDYNYESDLKRHLSRKHPQIDIDGLRDQPKKLMITGNGEIFEIDDDAPKQEPGTNQEDNDNDSSDNWTNHNEEINALHSTEFLDESAFDEPEPPTKQCKRPFKQEAAIEENSLDIFGRYIISLLKKLPKRKSDQLQAAFVKQIMEAQIDDQNNCYSSISNYESQMRNTRCVNNDDTHVSSNSEMQRAVTSDSDMLPLVLEN